MMLWRGRGVRQLPSNRRRRRHDMQTRSAIPTSRLQQGPVPIRPSHRNDDAPASLASLGTVISISAVALSILRRLR